jgi:hypothetical protein
MKSNFVIGILVSVLFFSACSNQQTQQNNEKKTAEINRIQLTDSVKNALIQRGDNIAKHAQAAFQTKLKKAIKSGGKEYAISFCNTKAMQITDSVSSNQNVQIRRLAKKYRNPLNETNEIESEIYKTYILEWLKRETLYPKIIANEQGHPVYYRPIGIQPVCLNCHGKLGKDIPSSLAEKIAALYPGDKAIDFNKGELRGMWAITFPEYIVEIDK